MTALDTAVAVVLFRPSPEQVARLFERFVGRVPLVLVFDNGGTPPEAVARLSTESGVRYLGGTGNVGIATALNVLVAAAKRAGVRHLLLLDQDADATLDTLTALAAAFGRLSGFPEPPAVVGAAPAFTGGHKAPRYPRRPRIEARAGAVPVEFLATSGSLIDLRVFDRVGPFRDDYFIDAVELEWCFRAWARGASCWMDTGTQIPHSVGQGVIRARVLPVAMPRQAPFRMATYIRNTVYGWRLPHVPGRWKRRQMLYLPLQIALYWADGGYRPALLARLLGAGLDGLRGRLGRPADAPP